MSSPNINNTTTAPILFHPHLFWPTNFTSCAYFSLAAPGIDIFII